MGNDYRNEDKTPAELRRDDDANEVVSRRTVCDHPKTEHRLRTLLGPSHAPIHTLWCSLCGVDIPDSLLPDREIIAARLGGALLCNRFDSSGRPLDDRTTEVREAMREELDKGRVPKPGSSRAFLAADSRGYDDVAFPSHYNQGRIQVWDFIVDQRLDYLAGCVVKYVARYRHKGTELKDLQKARAYLGKLIEQVENDERADDGAGRRG